MKSLVIFDLDGTLLNSIADLAVSANYALKKCGFPTHEVETYRFFIGNGINKLVESALPEGEKNEKNIIRMRQYFLAYYNKHNAQLTLPYEGINNLLTELQSSGISLAVASNKYQKATEELVQHFFRQIKFVAVLGQRDGIPIKPDPTILYEILELTNSNSNQALYIGDSGVDMQTAQNAKIDAIGVSWGFRPKAELEDFSPKFIVNKPSEILAIINQ